MRKERRNVPVPAKHFLTVIRIALPAHGVVAYDIETVGKRRAFGSSVRPAERNPVPGEQISFVMERCVSTGHNPVVTQGHGGILSEWKTFSICGFGVHFGVKPRDSGKDAVTRRAVRQY